MVPLRLNPSHDIAALGRAYQAKGRLRVEKFFTDECADAIVRTLETETPFDTAILDASGAPLVLPGDGVPWADARIRDAVARSSADFSFVYRSFPMLTAYQEHRLPGHFLHQVLEFMNSPPMLQFLRGLTGFQDIIKMDAQAALYEPGCFLTTHNDEHPTHRRRVAYVMGFTRRWNFDWGGLLLFRDAQGRVLEGLMPGFNTIDVFTVPQLHAVTVVTPAAQAGRYTITGWARA